MIVYLRDGRIIEQGSHEELVARGGAYYELYRRQQLVREVETLTHEELSVGDGAKVNL
jgi:ATP-binding cassette subfamily B protein